MIGKKGQWVEIHKILLTPTERTAPLPPDTQLVPFEARVKGFLVDDAEVGGPATIETVLGRRVSGTLLNVLPRHEHTFGSPVPELLSIGRELRALLAEMEEER
ncbi:MAG: 2-amino-4-oxopentanoate thiolase subunit OrtA [Chloroflexota bacterium]